jgi:hypothetical protein
MVRRSRQNVANMLISAFPSKSAEQLPTKITPQVFRLEAAETIPKRVTRVKYVKGDLMELEGSKVNSCFLKNSKYPKTNK